MRLPPSSLRAHKAAIRHLCLMQCAGLAVCAMAGVGTRWAWLAAFFLPVLTYFCLSAIETSHDQLGEQARAERQNYLSDIAHELRTHLAVIQARADSIMHRGDRKEMTEDVGRLARLLDQSLVIARLRAGEMTKDVVDLVSLARMVAMSHAPRVIATGRMIDFTSDATSVRAMINRPSIELAVRNLIENALDHAPDGSTIAVSVSERGAIRVHNDGPPIDPADSQSIFQPFWAKRDQRKGGVGLGLAVVREAAITMNGRARVSSPPSGGCTFSIELPPIEIMPAASTRELPAIETSPPLSSTTRLLQGGKHAVPLLIPRTQLEAEILAQIIDTSSNAIFVEALDGKIVSWNPTAVRLFGYSRSFMIGRPAAMLFPPLSIGDKDMLLSRLRNGERIEHFETDHVHQNGKLVRVMLTLSPLYDENNRIIGFARVARDVTSRQSVELALRSKLLLLSAITDHAAEAMILTDKAGDITFVNPAAERISGWKGRELEGRPAYRTLRYRSVEDETPPVADCPLSDAWRNGGTITDYEDIMVRKDGQSIDVSYSSAPIIMDGELTGSVLIVHDISARKRAEATLREALKIEAMSNLTGGLAHDFNNLLGVIIGNLDDLLDQEAMTPNIAGLAKDALNAALHGDELVKSLLAFARRQPLQPAWLEPNAVVKRSASILSRMLGSRVDIDCDLDPDSWSIMADLAQLEAALMNLAANARDAMPKGGRLTIRTRNIVQTEKQGDCAPGDYVMLEVQDSGEGVPDSIRAKIFDPFFTTKSQGKGTGLGLSMVFGFIRQSGGYIDLVSTPEGASFRLCFPRAISAPQANAPTECVAQAGDGETVLVVEDNDALRRIVCHQIQEMGYRSIEAVTADDALRILIERAANDQPVKALFTDVTTPGEMNGLDLLQEARMRWPGMTLIVTSGDSSIALDEKAGLREMVSVLPKPYRKKELASLLSRTTRCG